MERNDPKTKNIRISAYILCAALLVWMTLGSFILGQSVINALEVILFWAAVLVIPGVATYKLLRLRQTPLETVVTVFGLGFTLMTVEYFFFAPFGVVTYALVAAGVVLAASLVCLVKTRKRRIEFEEDDGEFMIAAVFACIAGLMTFILLSADMISPELTGTRFYFHDIMNGVGLTTSASNSFPMQILHMAGTEHRYHLFYYIFTGLEKLATGISSFEITTKYSLILLSPLAVMAFCALGKRIVRCNKALACITFIVTVIPGVYMYYLYQEVGGYQEGLFFALLTILFFLKAEEDSEKKHSLHYLLAAVFLIMCLGAKGPIAVPVVFGICFVLLIDLILRQGKGIIIKGLSFAVPFFAAYFLIYASGAGDSMEWVGTKNLLGEASKLPFVKSEALGAASKIAGCIAVIIKDSWITIFAIVVLILLIAKKGYGTEKRFAIFTLSATAIGYFLRFTFSQMGSSEIYFLNIMIPFSLIAFGLILKTAGDKEIKKGKAAAYLLTAALGIVILFDYAPRTVKDFWGTYHGEYAQCVFGLKDAVDHSRFSEKNLWTTEDLWSTYGEDFSRLPMINQYQYEAYIWLRDNTPKNAVIADGHYLLYNKYFYGTAFSERPFFLEGTGYVTMEGSNHNTPVMQRRDGILYWFFAENKVDFAPLIAKSGCDYIIISQYLNPGMVLPSEYGDIVFRNDIVSVYKLKK